MVAAAPMRRTLLALVCCATFASARAGEPSRVPPLLSGLGSHHHPITTRSADAQRWFDHGLALLYAFNHDGAARAFRQASALDPKAAMPHWGVALALGPNYNLDVDPEREQAAFAEIQRARRLAGGASAAERGYIDALARRFPDDLDAATLFAEAAMDLRPWQLWNADGTPGEGTEELGAVLESVLRCDREHPGASHFYHPRRRDVGTPGAHDAERPAPGDPRAGGGAPGPHAVARLHADR